jgi:apolipoprotein N-acyltransferase
LAGLRGALTLCGESFESTFSRGLIGQGADALFNLSNSLWTGDTLGTTLTVAVGPLRAVENRVAFVRVDTMGPSAVWGPDGRPVAWLPFGKRDVLRATLPISLSPGSFYSRHGDLFTVICALLAILSVL